MMTSKYIGWGAVLAAILAAAGCTAGKDGAKGPQGDPGAPGADGTNGKDGTDGKDGVDGKDAVAIGDVTGAVTDGTNPLQGVTVAVEGDSATATTDAQGKFSLTGLDVGAYYVTFSLAGYGDQKVLVNVAGGKTTTVNVSLTIDPATATPPTVTVTDNPLAGFNQPVTVKATATGKAPLTYAWTQLEGPTVVITGDKSDTISFTTQDFISAIGPTKVGNARFGTIGINPDEAGNYVFEVAVTDADGLVTKADVHVNATRPTAGLRMVPVGIPVWLQGDGPLVAANKTTWNWTIDTTGATGSTATIANPTAQFPSFVPDVKGTYVVKEGNKTMNIYAGTWYGEMTPDGSPPTNGSCNLCHDNTTIAPHMWEKWQKTRHFKGLAEKLDGVSTQYFAEECMSCHTVGYDKTAQNNGFDDVQQASGWTFPATLQAGNWNTLVNDPKLGQLAGIQCENCHGPQTGPNNGPHTSSLSMTPDTGARISWSADVCAQCHQEKPHHYKPGQWMTSKHADLELAYVDATVETRGTTAAHCGRCHTAQGYAQYVSQLQQGYTGNLTSDGKPATGSPQTNAATVASLTALGLTQATVQSQTCQSCHDPHDATNPSQLRIYDTVPGLPNGLPQITGAGSGVICMTCHNTRNGAHNDSIALTSYSAPHTPAQTDVMYGFNAYWVPTYTPTAHLAVKDTCAGCHYGVATDGMTAAKEDKNHSFTVDNTICKACHADSVNGDGLAAANETQLDLLAVSIGLKIKSLVNNALLPANGGGYTIRVWDPVSDQYSSAAASNVALAAAPTTVELFEVHGTAGFIFTMTSPMTVNLVDASGNPNGSVTTNKLYLAGNSLKNAAGTTSLYTAGSDYMKAMWNYYLLRGDGTKGIHNPSFFNAVVGVTSAKVAALP